MKLRDVMTREVEVISPETSVMEAAGKMRTLDVGSLPVCQGDKVLGVLTDRDIVIRAVAQGRDPRTVKAREVMTSGAESCSADDDVKDAADHMREKQIRRILVLDDDQKLVGIFSLGDLAVDADRKLAGKALEDISEPSQPASH
ncbi:MAG: CBS domain-containing protein [Myxococcota bacterium]|nr:CBS domain-containing protein [Myxococcota bacterium]